jgi:hypothetical protein
LKRKKFLKEEAEPEDNNLVKASTHSPAFLVNDNNNDNRNFNNTTSYTETVDAENNGKAEKGLIINNLVNFLHYYFNY